MPFDYLSLVEQHGMAAATPMPLERAFEILALHCARLFDLDGMFAVGVWRASICNADLKTAIATLHPDGVQVIELEDSRVPERYRRRMPRF